MEIKVSAGEVSSTTGPLLVIFAIDAAEGNGSQPSPALLHASEQVKSAIAILAPGEFKAGLGEIAMLRRPSGMSTQRLLLVGLGKLKDLTADKFRKAAGTAVRAAKQRSIADLVIAFPELNTLSETPDLAAKLIARALVEGALFGSLDYDTYRTDRKVTEVASLTLLVRSANTDVDAGVKEGTIVATAQNFTRSLVNEPGNVLTPTELGKRAKVMCDEAGLKCEVYSSEKIQELRMEAFWAVAKGSAQPPALIVMTYEPEGGAAKDAPVLGLVGKGITFDTGGISIKPADGMEKMKYDMAGAAAMIGAMQAISKLKPRVKVIGVVCSAENMPDGAAFKPGDVVTAMSGKTIEIVNTDAEGRLVLSDGLHYAKTLGCTHLINAATLTGACMIALGLINFGIFSNDDSTCERFIKGLETSGEKGWRLPCTDDYRDLIRSEIADIRNTGFNRYGGATTAAMFLKEFAGDTPWVHLDIAGCAWNEDKKPWHAYGPSGVAVRSIIEWVRSFSA